MLVIILIIFAFKIIVSLLYRNTLTDLPEFLQRFHLQWQPQTGAWGNHLMLIAPLLRKCALQFMIHSFSNTTMLQASPKNRLFLRPSCLCVELVLLTVLVNYVP